MAFCNSHNPRQKSLKHPFPLCNVEITFYCFTGYNNIAKGRGTEVVRESSKCFKVFVYDCRLLSAGKKMFTRLELILQNIVKSLMMGSSSSDFQFRSASIAEMLPLRQQSLKTKQATLHWIVSMAEISLEVCGDQATRAYSVSGWTRHQFASCSCLLSCFSFFPANLKFYRKLSFLFL